MDHVWFSAAVWLGLALIATLLSTWLKVSVALAEIVVGTVAQVVFSTLLGVDALGVRRDWIAFLAGLGSIVLTFLAGVELDPDAFRRSWREATAVGLVGFLAPFLGAAWAARTLLGWDLQASLLAGVALSTTSVAVVYAVMVELGLNRSPFGKVILAACFINDLGTVVALGIIFAPFGPRTLVFTGALLAALVVLFRATGPFFARYGGRTSELEARFLLFSLFVLGGLAVWSGSEAVLPAYLLGMVLAGTVGREHALVRRLRTLTFGLLTPFYFLRAGALVNVPVVAGAPGIFAVLFLAKAVSKFVGIFPLTRLYRYPHAEGMYTTLLMSTGLTFGTISALYGLSHGIITPAQYSFLVATVIASAVVPTWIANRFFLPVRHLAEATGKAESSTALATTGAD
ncbi:MAG: cation:proton antiporter [Armatimonadota bacterium]|nr:cation:proton antiporter [Armatimonadota bacterium]